VLKIGGGRFNSRETAKNARNSFDEKDNRTVERHCIQFRSDIIAAKC
jgi:hypothetical protein